MMTSRSTYLHHQPSETMSVQHCRSVLCCQIWKELNTRSVPTRYRELPREGALRKTTPDISEFIISPSSLTIDPRERNRHDTSDLNIVASSAQREYAGTALSIDFMLSDLGRAEDQIYAETSQTVTNGRRVENDNSESIISSSSLTSGTTKRNRHDTSEQNTDWH